MSSEKAGVQTKIKEVSPLAFYTHCYCHCLNLSLASACQLQEIRNPIGIINEAFLFLPNSAKRLRYFEQILEVYLPTCSRTKLVGLCKTRWVERHTCFEVFLEMYVAFVTFLDAMLHPHQHPQLGTNDTWDWDRDTLVKAQGMMAALTMFQNIAVFIITKNTLDIVKVLSVKLQKRDQNVQEAYAMIDDVMKSLESTRTTIDTVFESWYDEVLKLANEAGATESVPRLTTLQRNRSKTPSSCPMEHYKRTVAIPFLYYLCGQMEERFRGETHHTCCLFSLVPSILVTTSMQPDNILNNLLKWEIDLPFPKSLPSEARRWEGLWKTKTLNENKEQTIPHNLLQALSACDRDSFPNIHHLLLIACILPISSAEAERSFSLMKWIKTCTKSIMTEQRLSDLVIIVMHFCERISVEEVCKAFIQAHPRRMYKASLFLD